MYPLTEKAGMDVVEFDAADTYEPEPDWERKAFAGSDGLSLEYFEKPPGHSSPMHDHNNEQVCVCLAGELTVVTTDDEATLTPRDSVYLAGGEPHRIANETDDTAVGLDVFTPGRDFDFWTDRT